jgi:hypothetical protein
MNCGSALAKKTSSSSGNRHVRTADMGSTAIFTMSGSDGSDSLSSGSTEGHEGQ